MPNDERDNLLTEECGLQNKKPAGSSSRETDDIGGDDQGVMIENTARLDEIEALLRELSSEFRAIPDASAFPDAGSGEAGLPTQGVNDDTVRMPAAADFDLGKPVDYFPDPEGYDYRRAGEAEDGFALTAQTMASRLVSTAQVRTDDAPDASTMTRQPGSAQPDDEALDEAETEPARPAKRRMRLRPARRVSGSRPEPRVPWATSESEPAYSQHATPGFKPAGQTGRGFAFGAAATVLVIGGAAATVAFVEPVRDMLPVQIAQLVDEAKPSLHKPVTGHHHLAEAGTGRTEQDTGSFNIASGAADKPMIQVNPSQSEIDRQVSDQGLRAATSDAAPDEATRLPDARRNAVSAVERREDSRIPDREFTKSAARLNQDSIVQAIPKDPKKLALQDAETNEGNGTGSGQSTDAVVTGSIASNQQPAESVEQQDRSEFRNKTVQTTPVTGQADGGAQIRPGISTSGASAYAPSSPDVGSDVPFPGTQSAPSGTQTASVAPQREIAPPESAVRKPLKGIEGLLARGHELLENGQIASARLLFRRAASMGDERGARGMGMTFDPEVYRTLPVAGVTPDSEKAEYWYRKANELARHKRIPDSDDTDARSVEQN